MTAPTFAQRCAAIHAAGDRVTRRNAPDGPVGRVVCVLWDRLGEAALVIWPRLCTPERVALVDLEPAPLDNLRPRRLP